MGSNATLENINKIYFATLIIRMEEDDMELSPGFFDVHRNNDNNIDNEYDNDNDIDNEYDNDDEYEEDVNKLIPERISLESPAEKNNVLVDLFFLVFTTSDPSCGCGQKGWVRTSTY